MNLPTHVALIPDGNRRWAKQRGLPTLEGHRTSANNLPNLLRHCIERGIPYFTFWVMSTENFKKRSEEEVGGLFSLGKIFVKNKLQELKENGIRIRAIGNIEALSPDNQEIIQKAVEETKQNSRLTFIIAVNYGGRDEILRAMKKASQNQPLESLTVQDVKQYLDTATIPDPDLIIRVGGEQRLSGFMLWQSEYSELYFSEVLLPDFSPEEFEKALQEYGNRDRRFGR